MKKAVLSVIIMTMAAGAYAADLGQLAVSAKDIKVQAAGNKDIVTPSRDASAQDKGPAFMCGSAGYPLWSFSMKNEPTNYNPTGGWSFFWPSPQPVKPVAPKQSSQHTGPSVPSSPLNNALVYQTSDYGNNNVTIVITPCPTSGCPKDDDPYNAAPGQTHEILVISAGSVLFGTCHVQK